MRIRLPDHREPAVNDFVKSADETKANSAIFVLGQEKRANCVYRMGNEYQISPTSLSATVT